MPLYCSQGWCCLDCTCQTPCQEATTYEEYQARRRDRRGQRVRLLQGGEPRERVAEVSVQSSEVSRQVA